MSWLLEPPQQNEQYLEIMSTPNFRPATAALAENLGPIDLQTDFAHLRRQLLDAGLSKYLPAQRAEFDEGERRRRELEHCGASGATPACNLQVRFLYQVLRALSPQDVFVQLVCGFELASTDPLVVGINMVQPEDWRVSMANYQMQMRMVHALHVLYPRVHITLHAGELAPGDGAAGWGALSYPLRGRGGRCRTHRPRRGRDVRGSSLRSAQADGRQVG